MAASIGSHFENIKSHNIFKTKNLFSMQFASKCAVLQMLLDNFVLHLYVPFPLRTCEQTSCEYWCIYQESQYRYRQEPNTGKWHNNNQMKWASSWDYGTYGLLSHRQPAKAQVSLCTRTVSPEHSLFAHTKYGSIQRVRPKIRHLAPLEGCVCAFEEWVYGGQNVP